MDDLHKPLGQNAPTSDKGRWVKAGVLALGICLLSAAAYVFIDAKKANAPVVAKVRADVQQTTTGAPNVEQSAPSTNSEAVEGGTDQQVSIFNEDGELDLSNVKPLSPLEPVDDNGEILPEDAGTDFDDTAFKPQPIPKSRGSAWLPRADLVENSKYGPLPQISDGGVRPLDAYSQSSGLVGANRIAIIIGGMGLSQTGTKSAIEDLPSEVTLGFSPFGLSLQRWMQTARKAGHEVALQLPMEPLGYPTIDPGPQTLTSKLTPEQNLEHLKWSLGRMTNYPIVTNYLGAGLAGKADVLGPILEEIKRRGLGYVDDGSVQNSRANDLAKEMALPNAKGSLVIDSQRTKDGIQSRLRNLEAVAKQKGFAIGTATAFPQSVELIAAWAKTARDRGILLVPASNLLKDYRRN